MLSMLSTLSTLSTLSRCAICHAVLCPDVHAVHLSASLSQCLILLKKRPMAGLTTKKRPGIRGAVFRYYVRASYGVMAPFPLS